MQQSNISHLVENSAFEVTNLIYLEEKASIRFLSRCLRSGRERDYTRITEKCWMLDNI